jgi:transcriptional antiterminator RfaH
MKHWYVLHTKPHKEYQVADHLSRRKVEVYVPFIPAQRVNPRAARERPYFPCYLFARADLDAVGVSALQWTPGLRRLVEFGGQPAIVPDHFVFEIKRRVDYICEAGGLIFDGLVQGAQVKVTEGPFAGYEGIFDSRLSGSERVRVLLTLIAKKQPRREGLRLTPVELNVNNIAKVNQSL